MNSDLVNISHGYIHGHVISIFYGDFFVEVVIFYAFIQGFHEQLTDTIPS